MKNLFKINQEENIAKSIDLKIQLMIDNYISSKIEEEFKKYKNHFSENNKEKVIQIKKKTCNKYGLTIRELEILALICEGLNNIEIGEKLFITKSTAKAHVHSILQKLYAKNRIIATKIALKEDLVCLSTNI